MSDRRHAFDEALISGYLDGELTQGDRQRVRIHLEDCPECSELADEIARLREATVTSEFQAPEDNQWDEAPRGAASSVFRNFGWAIAAVWTIALVGWGLWLAATDSENWFAAMLVFGFFAAGILIFLSVLIDRLKSRRTDRYRKVEK